jgi:hypothetical protein
MRLNHKSSNLQPRIKEREKSQNKWINFTFYGYENIARGKNLICDFKWIMGLAMNGKINGNSWMEVKKNYCMKIDMNYIWKIDKKY